MHVVIAKYIIFFFASYNLDNMFCESATECKSVLHSIVANGNYLRQSFIFVIDIYTHNPRPNDSGTISLN